jgi:hypothetical protein
MVRCTLVEVVSPRIVVAFRPSADSGLLLDPLAFDQRMVSGSTLVTLILSDSHIPGTIRLWQTSPGKTYGLWQGQTNGLD